MDIIKYADNKRYYTLNTYHQQQYQSKVFKINLNANLTCPNRDGTLGKFGCIFCLNSGSDFGGNPNDSLKVQFEEGKKMMHKKWPKAKYIAYFGANSNTYAPLNKLKEIYEEVLSYQDVVGINISTRCDTITDEIIDYLSQLSQKTNLIIELGLQSMHDGTLKLINRGHDLNSFDQMVKKLKKKNIKIVVHIINGLPFETKEMMIETTNYLNNLKIDGIKIHMLHVLKNTKLASMYNNNEFKLLTKDEYIDIVCDQLERLSPEIVIHRLTGDPNINDLIEPTWLIKKFCVLNDIDKELKRRNSYQGKLLTN